MQNYQFLLHIHSQQIKNSVQLIINKIFECQSYLRIQPHWQTDSRRQCRTLFASSIDKYKVQLQVLFIIQLLSEYFSMKTRNQFVKFECSSSSINQSSFFSTGPFQITFSQCETSPIFIPPPFDWSTQENAKYVAFITFNKKRMENRSHSKLWPIYKQMSAFVKSRNFRQCKSHHYRLLLSCKSQTNITDLFIDKLENFEQLLSFEKENIRKFYSDREYRNEKKSVRIENDSKKANTSKTFFNQTTDEYVNQAISQISHRVDIAQSKYLLGQPEWKKNSGLHPLHRQWLQCHELFLEWTNKLQELFEMK